MRKREYCNNCLMIQSSRIVSFFNDSLNLNRIVLVHPTTKTETHKTYQKQTILDHVWRMKNSFQQEKINGYLLF